MRLRNPFRRKATRWICGVCEKRIGILKETRRKNLDSQLEMLMEQLNTAHLGYSVLRGLLQTLESSKPLTESERQEVRDFLWVVSENRAERIETLVSSIQKLEGARANIVWED